MNCPICEKDWSFDEGVANCVRKHYEIWGWHPKNQSLKTHRKVYVLTIEYPYEGEAVLGVFTSVDRVNTAAEAYVSGGTYPETWKKTVEPSGLVKFQKYETISTHVLDLDELVS